jgi:cell division protein FtsW (lipid II flippase)
MTEKEIMNTAVSGARNLRSDIMWAIKQFKYLMYFFAPEVILLVTSVIYFARNSLLSSPLYAAVFILFLIVGIAVKAASLSFGTGLTGDSLALAVIAFFTGMTELGVFFQLYIRTLTANEIRKLVLLFAGSAFLCAVLAFTAVPALKSRAESFRPLRAILKRMRAARAKDERVYWASSGMLIAFIAVLMLLFAATLFRHNFGIQLRLIETAKFMAVIAIAALETAPGKSRKDIASFMIKNAVFAVTVPVMGALAFTGEFGTLMILLFFFETSLLLTGKYRLAALTAVICIAGAAGIFFFADKTSHVYQRLFDITAFDQVNLVREELGERTYIWPNPNRYDVYIGGELATRCEDFSFLNMLTVLGKLAAVIILAAYLALTLIPAVRLAAVREKTFTERAGFYGAVMLLSSCAVHCMANVAAFFFTGVGLPFVSDGITNLIFSVIYVCLIALSLSRRKESVYETAEEA